MPMDYDVAGKPCYGCYQPSTVCDDRCWAVEICKQETIKLDGYYDRQAEEKAWWEDYELETEVHRVQRDQADRLRYSCLQASPVLVSGKRDED